MLERLGLYRREFFYLGLIWLMPAALGRMIIRIATDMSAMNRTDGYRFNPVAGLNIHERAYNNWPLPPLAWIGHAIFILAISLFIIGLLKTLNQAKLSDILKYVRTLVVMVILVVGGSFFAFQTINYGKQQETVLIHAAAYLYQGEEHVKPTAEDMQSLLIPVDLRSENFQLITKLANNWFFVNAHVIDFFMATGFILCLFFYRHINSFIMHLPLNAIRPLGKAELLGAFIALLVVLACVNGIFSGLMTITIDTKLFLTGYGAAALWAILYSVKWMLIAAFMSAMFVTGPQKQN